MVITRAKAMHALLYLVVSFLALALVFYVLGAPFVAALEVIIYAGAIMVLFLFALMLINPGRADEAQEREWLRPRAWISPRVLAAALLVELIYLLASGGVSAGGGLARRPRADVSPGEGGGHRALRALPPGRGTGVGPVARRVGGRSPTHRRTATTRRTSPATRRPAEPVADRAAGPLKARGGR